MTPHLSIMARPSIRALVSLALVIGAAWLATARVSASDATGYFGTVSLDGRAAPAGTRVEVLVDGVSAGAGTVLVDGNYVIEMSSAAGDAPIASRRPSSRHRALTA